MDVYFTDKKLENLLQDQRKLIKKHGQRRAKKLLQRVNLLNAVSTLADTRNFPGRCHELKGDRAGQLALDLDHPYRLIFKPEHDPIPTKDDGGMDWTAITAVTVLGVEDYHE